MGTYEIMPEHRSTCMAVFGMMTEEMDKGDAGECELLGRWNNPGSASGSFVCTAPNVTAIGSWLQNWITMANCTVRPCVDDNQAREIILKGEKPSFQASYYHKVGDEAPEGYSLYTIDAKIDFAHRVQCFEAFAGMTEEQDTADPGDVILMGRYHDLGTGTGFCICAAKSEVDLYKWAWNWASMCDCKIQPVMSDKEARAMITSKPNNALDVLKARAEMGMV